MMAVATVLGPNMSKTANAIRLFKITLIEITAMSLIVYCPVDV